MFGELTGLNVTNDDEATIGAASMTFNYWMTLVFIILYALSTPIFVFLTYKVI